MLHNQKFFKKSKSISATKIALSRRSAKIKIKKKRLGTTKRLISSIFKSKSKHGFLEYKAYLAFITLLQMPLHYVMSLLDIVLHYGAVVVLVAYTILLVGIGLPVFMLFVFMGSYCRKGFIKYWECIPLLKGAGYTIALMIIAPEFINATASGLSLLYVLEMFDLTIPWINCDFKRATNTCIIASSPKPKEKRFISDRILHTNKCAELDHNQIPQFSALNYLRFNKANQYETPDFSSLGSIKSDWAIAVIIVWIIVFVFMLQGFLNFQKIMKILQILPLLSLLIMFVITALSRHAHVSQVDSLYYGTYPFVTVEFWLQVFMHVCDRDEPGDIILLSSLRLTVWPPILEAFIVYGFKLLLLVLYCVWVPILLQNVTAHYNITDKDCLSITGFELFFAVVPDVLSRLHLPYLWILIWFLGLFIHSFLSVLYTYTGVVESLIEAWPKLAIYRSHICLVLCLLSMGINMLFVTQLGMVLFYTWAAYGMVVLRMIVLALVTFALTFIYSIARLVNDYHFAYGEPPTRFWVQAWKVAPFVVLFETAFMMHAQDQAKNVTLTSPLLKFLSYLTGVMMLLPIFSVMLWKYCTHVKLRMVSSIIRPEAGWGYHNLSKRVARKQFNPQTEVRYRTKKLKCKHHCLVRSKPLKTLTARQSVRKQSLLGLVNRQYADSEFEDDDFNNELPERHLSQSSSAPKLDLYGGVSNN